MTSTRHSPGGVLGQAPQGKGRHFFEQWGRARPRAGMAFARFGEML